MMAYRGRWVDDPYWLLELDEPRGDHLTPLVLEAPDTREVDDDQTDGIERELRRHGWRQLVAGAR